MATPTTLPATFVAGNVLTAAQMNDLRGAFRVLQVIQTVKKDTFSTTSSTFVDITGLTATITPSATSSKVLIIVDLKLSMSDGVNDTMYMRINGGNASTYIGDAGGANQTRAAVGSRNVQNWAPASGILPATQVYLDSPATTSATTYAAQLLTRQGTAWLNRSGQDTNSAEFGRYASSITIMEISA